MSRPLVDLAMIVRNGGAGLARCIRSALPAVDRIVVGDTGSTDNSRQIAADLGARVIDVPWEDDFSKARNAVLQACEGDWVLSLDADEMLDPAGAALIPSLVDQKEVDAWEVWRWNYIRTLNSRSGDRVAEPNPMILDESRPYPAFTRYLNTLLFRRVPGVYFENRVHETVSGRVRALGLRAAEAPFVIHHFGFAEDSEQDRKSKLEFYHQLGIEKVQLHPEDSWAHYELGLSELELHHDPQAALACFERAVALAPHLRAAWVYAGISLTRLGRLQEALEHLQRAEQTGARTALFYEAAGDVYFHAGDFGQAAQQYGQAAQIATLSPLVECKLGACYVALGNPHGGLSRIQAAVEREPGAGQLYEIWAAAALMAGDVATAARVATDRLHIGKPPVDSFIVAAGFHARLQRWDVACSVLREGLQAYPEDPRLQKELAVAEQKTGGQ